jgi:signal peptidase I
MTPRWQKILKEYAEAMIIAFVLAMIIRAFFIQAFKIPSGSMLDTLQIGDHLLVNKIVYGVKVPFTHMVFFPISDPERGDIIVFEFPEDPGKDFIKRIVGVPGDTIEVRKKVVYRNGEPLDEPYAQYTDPHTFRAPRDNMGPVKVPEDKFFVMGDNRDESYDSRFWGFVDRGAIKGRAWIIYWSWRGPSTIRWGRIGDLVH